MKPMRSPPPSSVTRSDGRSSFARFLVRDRGDELRRVTARAGREDPSCARWCSPFRQARTRSGGSSTSSLRGRRERVTPAVYAPSPPARTIARGAVVDDLRRERAELARIERLVDFARSRHAPHREARRGAATDGSRSRRARRFTMTCSARHAPRASVRLDLPKFGTSAASLNVRMSPHFISVARWLVLASLASCGGGAAIDAARRGDSAALARAMRSRRARGPP